MDDLRDHLTDAEIAQLHAELDPTVPPVRLGDLIPIAAFVMIAVPLVGAGIVAVVRGLG